MATHTHQDDSQFTVFIRLPFPRRDFVDPPPVVSYMSYIEAADDRLQVEWNAAKDQALWDILSRPSRGDDVDCMYIPPSV